jgi:hypothetical protein
MLFSLRCAHTVGKIFADRSGCGRNRLGQRRGPIRLADNVLPNRLASATGQEDFGVYTLEPRRIKTRAAEHGVGVPPIGHKLKQALVSDHFNKLLIESVVHLVDKDRVNLKEAVWVSRIGGVGTRE